MTLLRSRRRRFWRSALACAVLFSLFAHTDLALAQTIVVATSETFRPYAALIEDLLREAGFVPRVDYFPTERSFQMLVDGQVDMEFFRTQRAVEALNDKITLIGPVTCSELVAFKRIGSAAVIQKPEDLGKYRVAAQNGNKFAVSLATRNGDATLPPNTENLFRMLDADRFDIAIETERTGLTQINKLNLHNNIKRTGPILATEPAYLVLRNQIETWGPRIKKVFAKRKASGKWTAQYGEISVSLGLPRDIAQHCIAK